MCAVATARACLVVASRPMLDPEPLQRTSRDVTRCPRCHTDAIDLAGRVTLLGSFVRLDYRCDACGASFEFVRRPKL